MNDKDSLSKLPNIILKSNNHAFPFTFSKYPQPKLPSNSPNRKQGKRKSKSAPSPPLSIACFSKSRKSRRTARASASFARSSGDDGAFEPLIDVPLVYHEVEIKRVTDPVTERTKSVHEQLANQAGPAFLLIQRDASEQIMLENLLSDLTEDQLAMLSQIFPRHIIQALSTDGESIRLDHARPTSAQLY
eukprot:1154358-Pelagomonas_calceolata.AAC.11